MKNISVLLFDNFTILDALGPVEVFRCLDVFYKIGFYSRHGGRVVTRPDPGFHTAPFSDIVSPEILLIPGGMGTRVLVNDADFIQDLRDLADRAHTVLTVCTGSGLLARTGLLKGRRVTSNKIAFAWAMQQDPDAIWVRKARWTVDGKFYCSSLELLLALTWPSDRSSIHRVLRLPGRSPGNSNTSGTATRRMIRSLNAWHAELLVDTCSGSVVWPFSIVLQ